MPTHIAGSAENGSKNNQPAGAHIAAFYLALDLSVPA